MTETVAPIPPQNSSTTTELTVEGMTCSNCARHVTEAIQEVPGVARADVSLEQGRAVVHWKAGSAHEPAKVLDSLEKAGYPAKTVVEGHQHAHNSKLSWKALVILGVVCTVPLMAGEWFLGWGHEQWFRWASFFLATVVQFVCGASFYKGAWMQAKARSSNMDTLVALGSSTAYVFSVWGLFSGFHGHLYFMEGASIITLVSLGHYFEARASERASSALKHLLELTPATARKVNAAGVEVEVPLNELKPGDVVALRAGDRIPTDGKVIAGEGSVDESTLTGESLPIEKTGGMDVYAGTLLLDAPIKVSVTARGDETALAQIVAAVARAQSSRASIQRLADRISNVFVPIVVVIALVASLLWFFAYPQMAELAQMLSRYLWNVQLPPEALAAAFIHAAAVLIVACPCAMGLATPAALMAAANAAARKGILIRDGVALEKAGTISAVAFDKTGTLTEGKPELADTKVVAGNREYVLEVAGSVARASHHPLSRALAGTLAGELGLKEAKEIRGKGVEGRVEVNGRTVRARLGSLEWLGVSADDFTTDWRNRGATVLGIEVDGKFAAYFAVRDKVKTASREVIQRLNDAGVRTYLITGDNEITARAIAAEVGIDAAAVFAKVSPEGKANEIKKLQERGEKVCFLGDGINDAPALEQADLGIAVSSATQIAAQSADIVLLRTDLKALPESLELATATLRTIKQNLFWAFFYNSLGIPLAAMGLLSPVICAAAMGFSDLIVIGNSFRLFRFKSR